AGAGVVAERILEAVRALEIPHAESPLGRVTATIGLAAGRALSISDPQALVKAADRALYAAKSAGRDRLVTDEVGDASAGFAHAATRTNIRSQSNALVGRVAEIAALTEATKRSRIVTVVGRSGVGKTRIALAAANRRLYAYPDGTWLIDCSLIADGSMLEATVLGTLRVSQDRDRSRRDTLVSSLAKQHALLIFDDCERIAAYVSNLCEAIAAAAPNVVLLATCERPLACDGEEIFELREPSAAEAVNLFVDRAQAADKRFEVSERDQRAIERICARLGNVPLAIELAASRVRTMLPDRILEMLERENAATSIVGAIAWTYELLGENARQLFERLSVFPSVFTIEAARDICSGGDLEPWDVVDALEELTLANIAKRFESGDGLRYLIVEHARAFGREILRERQERTAIQSRYIRYFRAFVRRTVARMENGTTEAAIDDIRAEFENVEGALEYALNRRVDVGTGIQIAIALRRFWILTGRFTEGRRWTDIALASSTPQSPVHAELLDAGASISGNGGDMAHLAALSERLVAYYETHAGGAPLAKSLNRLAYARACLGEVDRARRLYQRALKEYRKAEDRRGTAIVLLNLGVLTAEAFNEIAGARKLLDESLTLFRELGMARYTGTVLSNLASLSVAEGNHDAALQEGNEAALMFERLGSGTEAAFALLHLAHARLLRGESELAREMLTAAREKISDSRAIRTTLGVFE
ncbi:MAG: tetratricopeptide repeat protein, partial [Candidatus Eremiobacteraeota bacterium]|nr:tetratricopeptide repeat protein [Candidatus Eremiobacteraeota bacterium]